jgi:hypothetical protein
MTALRSIQPQGDEQHPQSSIEIARSLPHPSSYAVPLLDAVLIEHGPADLLGRFFMRADAAIRDLGMRLAFSNDFSLLGRISAANRDSWYPLVPAYTAAGGAGTHNAYPDLFTQTWPEQSWRRLDERDGDAVCIV